MPDITTPSAALAHIADEPEGVLKGVPSTTTDGEPYLWNQSLAYAAGSSNTPAQVVQGVNTQPNTSWYNATAVYSGNWGTLKPWFVFGHGTGDAHTETNCAVKISNSVVETLATGASAWTTRLSPGGAYVIYRATQSNLIWTEGSVDFRIEGDALIVKMPVDPINYVMHGEFKRLQAVAVMSALEGIYHAMDIQLVKWDDALPIDYDNCNIVAQIGMDAVPDNNPDHGGTPGVFAGGIKQVTSTARRLLMANTDNIRVDSTLSPRSPTMTEARFEAVPPTEFLEAPEPTPDPTPEPDQPATLRTSGALKAGLIGLKDDHSAAAEVVRAYLSSGKIQIYKGTTKAAEASISVTLDDSLNIKIAQTVLTASATVSPTDSDLKVCLTNAAGECGLDGPIDGVTFTLNTGFESGDSISIPDLQFTVETDELAQADTDPGTTTSAFLGSFVSPSSSYVEKPAPSNAVRTLMSVSDTPYQLGPAANGWHRWATITSPGFPIAHERLHDWRDTSNADDGGMFTGNIVTARHTYNYDRVSRAKASNGNCPKIFPVYMFPKWMISSANITEVQARYGAENEHGQIHNVTRYPSFPYGGHPPENWDYIKEYIQAVYRPTTETGPGGERGFGYTKDDFPIVELGNEQKFAAMTVNAGRYWDQFPYGSANVRAFNLMTMQEFNEGLRAIKDSVPSGVLVAAGGYEGDFRGTWGKTAAAPGKSYSYFQAQMLSSDGNGGLGIDHVDIVFIHPYMYRYDPSAVQIEIDNAREQLKWLANYLGRPEIALIPVHCNETGHEAPTGVDGDEGTITYLINRDGVASAEATTGRDMKRTTLIAAANASRNRCFGITHYQDRPYSGTYGVSNGRQTYGAPSQSANLSKDGLWCNQIPGQIVRQAWELSTGEYDVCFESGLRLKA